MHRHSLLSNQAKIKQSRFKCLRSGCLVMTTKLWSDIRWIFTAKTLDPIVQGTYFTCCVTSIVVIYPLSPPIPQTSFTQSCLQIHTLSFAQFKEPKTRHFPTSPSTFFPTFYLDMSKCQVEELYPSLDFILFFQETEPSPVPQPKSYQSNIQFHFMNSYGMASLVLCSAYNIKFFLFWTILKLRLRQFCLSRDGVQSLQPP